MARPKKVVEETVETTEETITTDRATVGGFYGTVTPDANASSFTPLPVSAKEGAPKEAKYLVEFQECKVIESGDDSKLPGRPFGRASGVVIEPEYFEDRKVQIMFYLPPAPEDPDDADGKKVLANVARLLGQIDIILGEGAGHDIFGEVDPDDNDMLREAFEDLMDRLGGEQIVVQLGLKKSDAYGEQNVIRQYFPVDAWEGE